MEKHTSKMDTSILKSVMCALLVCVCVCGWGGGRGLKTKPGSIILLGKNISQHTLRLDLTLLSKYAPYAPLDVLMLNFQVGEGPTDPLWEWATTTA